MKRNRVLIYGGIAVVVLGIVGFALFSKLGISADSIEAMKGTKIQLVDDNGTKIEKQVPISLVFNGTVRQCTRTRALGFKINTNCKTVNKSFSGTVLTNEDGEYLASTTSYRPLSKDELRKIAESLLAEQLNRELTAEEKQLLQNITYQLAGIGLPTQEQVTNVVKKNLTIGSGSDTGSIISSIFFSPVFSAALSTGKEQHNFQLLNIVAGVKTNLLTSDTQTVSFYASDYKASTSLTVKYAGAKQLEDIKNLYFAEIDKQTTGTADSKTAIKQSITDFVDYMSFYFVHVASEETAKTAGEKILDVKEKASVNAKKTLSAPIFGSLFK